MQGYFDTDGILMVIPTDEVNEAQMRYALRYEKERGEINGVFYQRIQHHKINQLFISNAYKAGLESETQLVAKRKDQEKKNWKALPKSRRIALRRFHQAEAGKANLADRVSFFEPTGALETQVCSRMQELVDENLERYIGRRLLADDLPENHPLKACLEASCHLPLPFSIAPVMK